MHPARQPGTEIVQIHNTLALLQAPRLDQQKQEARQWIDSCQEICCMVMSAG